MEYSLPRSRWLLLMAYIGFVSLGLPDALIGVAWPSVREHFHLQQSAVALVFFGSGCSYFVSSLFTGRILKSISMGTLLASSSALVAMSGFGFGAAAIWPLFAAFALVHGLGSGAIDAGLNHYAAHHFSARHMNWLHACYSLGATLGPLIMTGMIAWQQTWRAGYLTVGSLLLALSLLFVLTRNLWNRAQAVAGGEGGAVIPAVSLRQTLRRPLVWLQVVIFFVYTGLELMIGQWAFTLLTESRGVSPETAGLWVTVYWGSICAGRILFGFVVDRMGVDTLVRLSLITSVVGTSLLALNLPNAWSAISLALSGLGLAAIFPCLMNRTPERLGKADSAHAIGLQVSAAMIGAAALPSFSGYLAQHFGLELLASSAALVALVLCLLHEVLMAAGKDRNTPSAEVLVSGS